MPVQIEIETNVTLAELVMLKQNGYMVEETPHVGNLAISTLALMSLGFSPNLVDVTTGEKDNLFYPHCVIENGRMKDIAPANLMTTHNRVYGLHGSSMPLTDFHTSPLTKMGLPFTPHCDWLATRQDPALKVIETVTKSAWVHIWRRYVNNDGSTTIKEACRPKILAETHKVTSPPDKSGWVIPNPINILLDLVIGSRETGKDVIYMLSGQSMYKYIQKGYNGLGPMDQLISFMYDQVRNSDFPDLPENLTVKMVPTPALRHFVSPSKLKDQLDRKLNHHQKLQTAIGRCGRKMSEKSLSLEKMTSLRDKRKQLFVDISDPLSHVCADSETGSFYSQYDLLKNRDTVYIPDHVMSMRMLEMMVTAQKMSKLAYLSQC